MKRTGKTLLCLALAVSLVMTLFVVPVSVSAHPSSATLVSQVGDAVNIDFNYSTGTGITSGYYFDKDRGIVASHSLPDWQNKVEQSNQYLEMGVKEAGTRSRLTIQDNNWKTYDLTKDCYFTEFKFKLNALTPIDTLFRAELCSAFDSINWAASSPYVWAGVVQSGGKYYIKAGNTTITLTSCLLYQPVPLSSVTPRLMRWLMPSAISSYLREKMRNCTDCRALLTT